MSYEDILKQYEQDGIIPVAKALPYASWSDDSDPHICPYCWTVFSVNLRKDQDNLVHCPVCCMEVKYESDHLRLKGKRAK